MIKKIFFTLVIAISLIKIMHAQCVPNPLFTRSGIYPDSATGFVRAFVDTPYVQVMTFIVPRDTQLAPAGYPKTPFDSVVLKSFTGLPNGFSYSCNPPVCKWVGGTKGCINIIGTPSWADIGIHHLKFMGSALVGGGSISVPIEITYYSIEVVRPLGMVEKDNFKFTANQNIPNPFSRKTQFNYSLANATLVYFNVYNILGKEVFCKKELSHRGINIFEFEAGDLPSGVYFCTFSEGLQTITRKMIIN